ncbi:MAG: oxidoreductase [Actinobacteria bacterium]|nr:oxidoreductase [Actinomycetota bacterium]
MKPRIAVWKFSSCDGCQLSLLDCEDELLALGNAVEIAYFLEATSRVEDGPYDVSIVEGSITTAHDEERIQEVRENSGVVVAIGACATAGGIQALKNFADVEEYKRIVYAHPEYVDTLATSTPIGEHIKVDVELRGCPIDRGQLLAAISALVLGHAPRTKTSPVCLDCKQNGITCVLVSKGRPCLGPITQTGCGALCPSIGRGCFGCFGPADTANVDALTAQLRQLGMTDVGIDEMMNTYATTQFRKLVADQAGTGRGGSDDSGEQV